MAGVVEGLTNGWGRGKCTRNRRLKITDDTTEERAEVEMRCTCGRKAPLRQTRAQTRRSATGVPSWKSESHNG